MQKWGTKQSNTRNKKDLQENLQTSPKPLPSSPVKQKTHAPDGAAAAFFITLNFRWVIGGIEWNLEAHHMQHKSGA